MGEVVSKSDTKKRTLIKIGVFLFLIFVIGLTGLLWQMSRGAKEANLFPCESNGQLLQNAVNIFSSKNVEAQLQLAAEIEKTPNHQNDINCAYILTQAYINLSDPELARKNLDFMKKAVNEGRSFSPVLKDVAKTPEELTPFVEFIEQVAAQRKSNPSISGGVKREQ